MTRSAIERSAFPTIGLLAFTVSGFLTIMTENMPSGLLPEISSALGVSESLAGQLLTLYALGSVVAAIPIVTATRGIARRPLLLTTIAALLVFNSITALSGNYAITLVARFIAGMAAGVIWGLLAGYARRLVPPHQQGKAMAVVGVGQPIALSLGVPLGAWLGTLLDWRGVFWVMSAVALVLLIWIRLAVPNFPGQPPEERTPLRKVATIPGLRPILAVIFVWILAHNILYTYIAPFTKAVGIGENKTGLLLLIFGVASVVGVWFVGLKIDAHLRPLTILSLAGFAVAALILAFATDLPAIVYIGTALWGLTFGGAPTILQTATADVGGNDADVAISLLVTVFNLAVAGGGLIGGVLLTPIGAANFPWLLLGLAVVALGIAWSSTAGFRPGRRAGSEEESVEESAATAGQPS
ncbi:MFS transporter [Gordonia soli]|uniref:Putative major facilitator superfamily transporter n=1 Tax=Gordonia soli NBRC 108243 TaxID=1223545 RepID=M0QEB2_9ACTN|nr:MFS transporter [Gordonia soli]GAC66900.1 putative major facilitator superfamily transporter [Gordonia soli NBRC 108243]